MKIHRGEIEDFRQRILLWYDKHRRVLPWRALAGEVADPYKVWLSEIMLQQTTVTAVIPYFEKFCERWPTVQDLANANDDDVMKAWAGLGYYARARNLLSCAREVTSSYSGVFPKSVESLKKLPGIGDYTAAAVGAIAFGLEANVVDGNVERVMARLHNVLTPMPKAKMELKSLALAYAQGQKERTGDYAQALMDLGATICTPKSPLCSLCPVHNNCLSYQQGSPAELPKREAKVKRPQRIGVVYWIEDEDGRLLLQKRPKKGLLGGMLALPTTEWGEDPENQTVFGLELNYPRTLNSFIDHQFTHFDLKLFLGYARAKVIDDSYVWASKYEIKPEWFPTVFRKAYLQFMKSDQDH